MDAGGATDAEATDTITYSWDADTDLGLTLAPATGMISGTPTKAYNKVVTVTATATGGTATRTVNITIDAVPPSVSSMVVSNLDATARTFQIKIVLSGAKPTLTAFTSASLAATDKTGATVRP